MTPGSYSRKAVHVALRQRLQRRPGLPARRHVLPLLLADRALRRRLFAVRILHAAGGADEVRHEVSLGAPLINLRGHGRACPGHDDGSQASSSRIPFNRPRGRRRPDVAGLPDIRHAITLSLPRRAGPSFGPRDNARGMERRAAHQSSVLPRSLAMNAGASRRSTRRFLSRGPRFLGRAICASPSPAGSLRRGRSAPDRVPGPPECVAANHARGRRACPTSRTPLEAPLMSRR